jgi:threonine/homoserine efflux transporter RhtA
MIIVGVWWVIYKSHLSEQWQLYGVIVAAIAVCFGLYYLLGRRRRIARRVREKYGVSIIEFENMTNKERQQLKEKKSHD